MARLAAHAELMADYAAAYEAAQYARSGSTVGTRRTRGNPARRRGSMVTLVPAREERLHGGCSSPSQAPNTNEATRRTLALAPL